MLTSCGKLARERKRNVYGVTAVESLGGLTLEFDCAWEELLADCIDVVANPELVAIKYANTHTLQPIEPQVVWVTSVVPRDDSQIDPSREDTLQKKGCGRSVRDPISHHTSYKR